jgi:hypothetical protein
LSLGLIPNFGSGGGRSHQTSGVGLDAAAGGAARGWRRLARLMRNKRMALAFSNQYFSGTAGVTQGGWVLQATELRCGMTLTYLGNTMMLYGGSQWGSPGNVGPYGEGEGAQIYAQYSPPSGPLAIECQMPPYETGVVSMVSAQFSGASIACAGTSNSLGYGRVWTRSNATNSWRPTTIWNNATGAPVQVRSMLSYTDSVTGVAYLFAGSDDTNGNGGIFRATYNSAVPGYLAWDPTPELAISATNQGVTLPQALGLRVMSFCAGTNASGGTSLFATVGIQVWERIDGANPTWKLVWTKPIVAGEISESGLRGITPSGGNLLVFPEGNDWSVVQLDPASGFAPTWQYNLQNLQDELGTGFGVFYVIGPYNNMASVEIGTTSYGLIGLGIQVSAYPSGTPVYSPASSNQYWMSQSHYLVKRAATVTLCAMTQQANPTAAVRFMVPYGSTYVMAGGFDFENFTEAAEYGWGAYDTQSNAVTGT